MPISSVDIWNDAAGSSIKCYVLPANDYYRQSRNIPDSNYLPAGWMTPSFNDSSWSNAVFGPGGATLANAIGAYAGPNTVPAVWAGVTGGGSSFESVVFRHSAMVPAGIVTGVRVDLWFQSFVVYNYNFQNTFRFQYSYDFYQLLNYGRTTELWINGHFYNTANAADIVSGSVNTFAFWFMRPQPAAACGGTITEQLAGCTTAPVWQSPAFVGWRIHLDYTTPIPDYPPIETLTVVGPWGSGGNAQGGNVLPGGPIEVLHAVGWDGSGAALAGRKQETPYGTWNSSFVLPPQTQSDNTASYIFHDSDASLNYEWLAQGFNAQWTQLEWVRIGLRVGQFASVRVWPVGITAVCEIYTDVSGLPGSLMAASTLDISTAATVDGPICFQFSPAVTLVPGTNYWVMLHFIGPMMAHLTSGSWIEILSTFWECNGPPYPAGVNPPVYGLPWQGYQAMVAQSDGVWKQLTRQFIGPCSNTIQPDIAAVWDISIGAEGLALPLRNTLVSCPPNGMGTGGRIDPNLGSFPSSAVMSGWSVDGPVAVPPVGVSNKFVNNLDIMGFFTDVLGSVWVIGAWYNPVTTGYSWGPVLASRTVGVGTWSWPDMQDPVSGQLIPIVDGRAVQQSGGMIVALLHNQVYDIILGRYVDQLWLQTLNGSSYSTPVDLGSARILDLINDGQGNTHVFFSRQSTHGTPYYHLIVYSDGTVTPEFSWDCGIASGFGTTDPATGGAMFPYVSKSGCFFAVVFYPNGTGPDYQELPSYPNTFSGRGVPNSYRFIAALHGTIAVLLFVGGTGYMFCQDTVGISVAKQNGGTWTGLAPWTTDPDLSNLMSIPSQSALTANYIASRNQIGVAYSIVSYNFFDWFPDNLSYPQFFPTGCQPQPCLGGISGSGAQLIG